MSAPESPLDPALHESAAASNLADLLERLSYAVGEQTFDDGLIVSVSFSGANKARQPSEAFRQYLNRHLTLQLNSLRKDWISSLEKHVAAARQNLAEIQERNRTLSSAAGNREADDAS